MVEAKDQGHNFSKLWLANFPLFLSAKVFTIDNAFCYVFDDNSNVVLSKNNECHFEVVRVSRNADYVS